MNPHPHRTPRPAKSQVQHIIVTLKPELTLQSVEMSRQIMTTIFARVLDCMVSSVVASWAIEVLNESTIDTFAIFPLTEGDLEVDAAWQITNQLHRQPEVLYATLLLHR